MVTGSVDRVTLIQPYQALESFRDSGFDLAAAVGEVVDNAIQAEARTIRIRGLEEREGQDRKIGKFAFADDGTGIPPETLAHVLSLGFSTRYGSRHGLGRFGVGLKLAGLSQGRRIEIYTRPSPGGPIYFTYLDLNEIKNGVQTLLQVVRIAEYPSPFADLMTHAGTGKPFSTGTLIIWSEMDRLVDGGRFGSSIHERFQELTKFLARTYRRFIAREAFLELNGRRITLHDPLFLMPNPRVERAVGRDVRAEVVEKERIRISGRDVMVTVTLLPPELRSQRGRGGQEFKDLYIAENERAVSIMREDREIFYGVLPRLFPSDQGKGEIDRYIGIEVSFPATLDEFFQVRNVKRGAEPVGELRNELRKRLKRPVEVARRKIREDWEKQEQVEKRPDRFHEKAARAVAQVEVTAPRGRANWNTAPRLVQQTIDRLLEDLGITDQTEAKAVEEVVRSRSINLITRGWPGSLLLDIEHLNGQAFTKLNQRHLFIERVMEPIRELAKAIPEEVNPAEAVTLFRLVEAAIPNLFMAYARAEGQHPQPDRAYRDLRERWGKYTESYVDRGLSDLAKNTD